MQRTKRRRVAFKLLCNCFERRSVKSGPHPLTIDAPQIFSLHLQRLIKKINNNYFLHYITIIQLKCYKHDLSKMIYLTVEGLKICQLEVCVIQEICNQIDNTKGKVGKTMPHNYSEFPHQSTCLQQICVNRDESDFLHLALA